MRGCQRTLGRRQVPSEEGKDNGLPVSRWLGCLGLRESEAVVVLREQACSLPVSEPPTRGRW